MAERTPIIFTPGYGQEYYVSRQTPRLDTHWGGPYISASHNRVMNVFRQEGFEPYFNQPDWRERDPRRWAVHLADRAKEVPKNGDRGVVLAGFSVGALLAFQAAELLQSSSEIQVEGVLGASFTSCVGMVWHERSRLAASNINNDPVSHQQWFDELELPRITSPIQLYIGTQEADVMREFHEVLLFEYPQAKSIKPPCAHNILDESYVEALRQNVSSLLTTT